MKKHLTLLLIIVSFITACKKNNNSKPSTPVITTVVSTFAGSGSQGSTNGFGTAASFDNPIGVAVDASSNIYVAEQGNSLIRKISPTGVVSTFAGSGVHNTANGIGTAASFYELQAIAVDASGNVYVIDGSVRKITPDGIVSTLQGGNSISGRGIAVDVAGNIYVADPVRHVVRKISSSGTVGTFGTASSFDEPIGVAVDASGNVYVTDIGKKAVYKINVSGVISTLASNVDENILTVPTGIAVDRFDNIYVTDFLADVIFKITSTGVFSTFAGSGVRGKLNGVGTVASFFSPNGIAVDVSGNIYVADSFNNLIRKIVVQ